LFSVFIGQIDSGGLVFALFYIGGGVVGEHIVKASFLFISLYQRASGKCCVFLVAVPDWGANRRNWEGVK
jgi:hypothetical protein